MQARSAKEEQTTKRLIHFQGFFFYPPLMAFLIAASVAGTADWPSRLAFFLPLGFVIWMFIEYGLHRLIFHRPERGKWWTFLPWVHGLHHDNPRDVRLILSPVWFSLPISVVYWTILRLLTGEWRTSTLILCGILIGYLWYEFVHYSSHCRIPSTRLIRFLKTYHLLHHHTSDAIWFGVTSPFIDRIFGTYRKLPASKKS